jgi:hypothetical protein
MWDVLRTPAFAEAYGQSLARHPRKDAGAAALRLIESCLTDVGRLLVLGSFSGEFRPLPHGSVARLIVSSLVARAHWCSRPQAIDPTTAGACTRVVAETLDLLLPAITLAPSAARARARTVETA